jgi:hypothetical protein
MDKVYMIKRTDSLEPSFYSFTAGRDLGSPGGGWTPHKEQAAQFARKKDADGFMKVYLSHTVTIAAVYNG